MTQNTTLEYFEKPANGAQPATAVDNRLQILVDGKMVETWELMVMEGGKVAEWLMVFARYLARGDRLVSPGLPSEPLDELSRGERAQIMNSQAYKLLKRFKLASLRMAAESFMTQASTIDNDPN